MTRKPYALANALRKIDQDPLIEAVRNHDVAQLFIENPQPEEEKILLQQPVLHPSADSEADRVVWISLHKAKPSLLATARLHRVYSTPSLPRDCIAWYSTLPDNNDTLKHSFQYGTISGCFCEFKGRINFHSTTRCNRAGAGVKY